ncbi:molybdate ABC transporter substrate-binding protein [Marinospirillum perlucidum]|uniref:molybdate ABC transporter substrate-binding protein n=1 Tax=Marinospirillum perlucidum TaxID=1982602 RepID=UPI000DF38C09|nr:molybdate ABC transporter substrate-binding protein [Marinospirillum perlucidum]
MKKVFLTLVAILFVATTAQAKEIRVAVAANFNGTLEQLAELYQDTSGHQLVISSGSTGSLFAQIQNGAPFDVFFAADSRRPQALVADGLALSESLFTYAQGVVVLWSADPNQIQDASASLTQGDYQYLALANPRNAPYGAAAQQVLEGLGIWEQLEAEQRLLRGQNIGQTYSQVASQAAPLGFVALSQIKHPQVDGQGSWWLPPTDSYDPIVQQAVILETAEDPQLAAEFMAFIRSPQAAAIIRAAGYTPGEGN